VEGDREVGTPCPPPMHLPHPLPPLPCTSLQQGGAWEAAGKEVVGGRIPEVPGSGRNRGKLGTILQIFFNGKSTRRLEPIKILGAMGLTGAGSVKFKL